MNNQSSRTHHWIFPVSSVSTFPIDGVDLRSSRVIRIFVQNAPSNIHHWSRVGTLCFHLIYCPWLIHQFVNNNAINVHEWGKQSQVPWGYECVSEPSVPPELEEWPSLCKCTSAFQLSICPLPSITSIPLVIGPCLPHSFNIHVFKTVQRVHSLEQYQWRFVS